MVRPDLDDILATLEAAAERKAHRKIDFWEPYAPQKAFLDGGATHRERLFMAGNQVGKSDTGAFEAACHATGEYPPRWKGRRWTRPTRGWIAGKTASDVRDIQQRKLCGPPGVPGGFGTGLLPMAALTEKPSLARGVTDAYDTVFVNHVAGGVSSITAKSYDQGRERFQGEGVDWIWDDEEPPEDIYGEEIARLTASAGMIFVTFTPLKGMSNVVRRYLSEPSPDRAIYRMGLRDAKHIDPERREQIIAGYRPHEREARVNGTPMLGEGAVFRYSREMVAEPPIINLPLHWPRLWGVDFGIDHPFAAALISWDRDNDVIHVMHTVRMRDALPWQHAAAMIPTGSAVPVAWPHDGTARDKGSGEPLAKQYRGHGLLMLGEHATWPDGGYSFEAGITEMDERFATNRLKIASYLEEFFEEMSQYHRKEGQVVKAHDDILSATRIAIMMKRYAKCVPLGPGKVSPRRHGDGLARGVDFDVFA